MSWWGPRWGWGGVGGACNWKSVARWALELNEPMHVGSQEALGVGEGDVEAWVVRAIGKKLLEARIDQMRRTVAVTKCAQRTFSTAQWRALLAQLGAWKVCAQANHFFLMCFFFFAGPSARPSSSRWGLVCTTGAIAQRFFYS